MSVKPSITVILANRPRLFRELLHHALKTASPKFNVLEAADGTPITALLRDAQWLIVDEDMATEANRLVTSHPGMGILSLDGRGGRMSVLATPEQPDQHWLSEAPTLRELIHLLLQGSWVADANGVS